MRRARVEVVAFAAFAVLHLPGTAVALAQGPSAAALASVGTSLLLWVLLTGWALVALRRGGQVPRALLAAALATDVVVLTVSGVSPPRPGNAATAAVGVLALCVAAAVLTRPRLVPVVLVPAVAGLAVLLRAADAAADASRLVADVATVVAASTATCLVITWLEHERREASRALARAALTDPLTGLLNRRGLEQGLHARAAGRRGAPALGVVVLDVDLFKGVNDRRGHAVGDAVLVAVADALRGCARGDDLLVRLGGEELAWLAPWSSAEEAAAAAERLRSLVPPLTEAAGERVTISAGVAATPVTAGAPLDTALAGLLARADAALYRAKARGRDRVELGDDAPTGAGGDAVPAQRGAAERAEAAPRR